MTTHPHDYALFISHQGFTDIINTLGLLNYLYCKNNWNTIHVIIREEAKELLEYFIRDKPNIFVYPVCMTKLIACLETKNTEDVHSILQDIVSLHTYDTLIIGCYDIHNTNEYKNRWIYERNFVKQFYVCYGVDYMARITNFSITRDLKEEDMQYARFVSKYGNTYSLSHLISQNEARASTEYPLIELDQYSSTMFDCIKILENAQELHLLDSVWAALVYCLRGRYALFETKRIVIYAKRDHSSMFLEPKQFPNIEVI